MWVSPPEVASPHSIEAPRITQVTHHLRLAPVRPGHSHPIHLNEALLEYFP